VRFTVVNNKLTTITLGFVYSDPSLRCTADLTNTAPAASTLATIANAKFTYTLSALGISTPLTGTFSSASEMAGTFGQVKWNNVSCGPGLINAITDGGQFSARRQ
jgi:hypothetical protein